MFYRITRISFQDRFPIDERTNQKGEYIMARYKWDGELIPVEKEHLEVGAVLRLVDRQGRSSTFSDCIVVGIPTVKGEAMIDLARPWGKLVDGEYQTETERLAIPISKVVSPDSMFRTVLASTGKPLKHCYNK